MPTIGGRVAPRGIDGEEFSPIMTVTVTVGDQRRKGWVRFPRAGEIPVTVPPQAARAF